MKPDLSICVPTYDSNSGRVRRLMDSVFLNTPQSTSLQFCVEDCKGVLRGYTEPMNKAVAKAKSDCLLLVNDDVEMTPGWFPPMLSELCKGTWCVTPDATHTDGPQVFHPWCMLWNRRALEEIGGLDERFYFWASDIDLARRLIDAGHPPVKIQLPNHVTHQLNATAEEHPELGEICMRDLDKFRAKWGISAEDEKHRLAAHNGF